MSYGNFKLWKLSFHGILVNKHTLLGPTSLVKSDFHSLSHRSLSSFLSSSSFFFLHFSFFLSLFFLCSSFCSSSEQNLTHTERQKNLSPPHPWPLFSNLIVIRCPSPLPHQSIRRTTSQRRSTLGCVNSNNYTARLEWWLWVWFL